MGVGAWAAADFFATGAQPSEALPAATIGYASIDLDPSGGQKIEALRTLNKFPAFKEELGLDADDDIRKALFEELDLPEDCKSSSTPRTSSRGSASGPPWPPSTSGEDPGAVVRGPGQGRRRRRGGPVEGLRLRRGRQHAPAAG